MGETTIVSTGGVLRGGSVHSQIIKVSPSKGRLSGLEEQRHVPGQGGCGSFMSEHLLQKQCGVRLMSPLIILCGAEITLIKLTSRLQGFKEVSLYIYKKNDVFQHFKASNWF